MCEVEHVLERFGVEVAGCQMRSLTVLVLTQKTLLNEREQRSMVGNPVRDVVRPGKRGDRNEGHAEAELIEVRARCRIRTSRREAGADSSSIDLAYQALRSSAGLLARRWVREIGTLPGVDPIRIWRAALLRFGRRNSDAWHRPGADIASSGCDIPLKFFAMSSCGCGLQQNRAGIWWPRHASARTPQFRAS
jgi:hypothetical protein